MKTIALVYGGESCEHDISVITALSAYNMIKKRHKVRLVYMKNRTFYVGEKLSDIHIYKYFLPKKFRECTFKKGKLYIKTIFGEQENTVDCILMCNHGGRGEDGSLSGYFEVAGIPYTASGVLGSSLCMDKVYSKMLLEKFKFPVVNYRIYRKGYRIEKPEELGYPVIIKPARLGSSVGISYATNREELEQGVKYSLQYDSKLLIERALEDFEEYNCAVLDADGETVVSDVEHPVFKNKYLDFNEKYVNSWEQEREIPAKIDSKLRDKIKRMSREIYMLFELSGVVRIDFLYCENKLYVNEINTIPGSLSCYLFKTNGYKGRDIIDFMISDAIEKAKKKKILVTDYASDVLKNFNGRKLSGGLKK